MHEGTRAPTGHRRGTARLRVTALTTGGTGHSYRRTNSRAAHNFRRTVISASATPPRSSRLATVLSAFGSSTTCSQHYDDGEHYASYCTETVHIATGSQARCPMTQTDSGASPSRRFAMHCSGLQRTRSSPCAAAFLTRKTDSRWALPLAQCLPGCTLTPDTTGCIDGHRRSSTSGSTWLIWDELRGPGWPVRATSTTAFGSAGLFARFAGCTWQRPSGHVMLASRWRKHSCRSPSCTQPSQSETVSCRSTHACRMPVFRRHLSNNRSSALIRCTDIGLPRAPICSKSLGQNCTCLSVDAGPRTPRPLAAHVFCFSLNRWPPGLATGVDRWDLMQYQLRAQPVGHAACVPIGKLARSAHSLCSTLHQAPAPHRERARLICPV